MDDRETKISDVRSKHFYWSFMEKRSPSAIVRWESKGFLLDWENIFNIPYLCTQSTRLQTLHYRVVNRFVPTNRYLFIRKVKDSPACTYCTQEDTLTHFLYACAPVKLIWDTLFNRIHLNIENPLKTVLFGIPGGDPANNVIFLLIKQFILKCRLSEQRLTTTYEGAKSGILHHIRLEEIIAVRNNNLEKHNAKWAGIRLVL